MKTTKIQPYYQLWLNTLCRNFVARIKTIPEVVMVAVQPYNESGLPDFFVLLDDLQPAEKSLARFKVTQAVLDLRWLYANPWLMDYYFLNLDEYRTDNPDVSWRDFINEGETIFYLRNEQPFDMRVPKWGGAAAGMLGCAFLTLLVTVSNRNSPSSSLTLGLQSIIFLLPLLLIAGYLGSICTLNGFNRANLWSNGEGVSSAWTESMVESGLVIGGVIGFVLLLPSMIGFQSDFLVAFGSNVPNVRKTLLWELPPPLNAFAYINPTTILYLFTGLILGLIIGFSISLMTGWLVKRWAIANPIHSGMQVNDSKLGIAIKFLALAITFAALYFACYNLWPIQSVYSAY